MFPVCPSRLEDDVPTLHVAQLAQALSAGLPQVSALCWSEGEEIADTRNSLRLLRCEAERHPPSDSSRPQGRRLVASCCETGT